MGASSRGSDGGGLLAFGHSSGFWACLVPPVPVLGTSAPAGVLAASADKRCSLATAQDRVIRFKVGDGAAGWLQGAAGPTWPRQLPRGMGATQGQSTQGHPAATWGCSLLESLIGTMKGTLPMSITIYKWT